MTDEFRFPDFGEAELELRFEKNVVCIYGTKDGLRKVAELCQALAAHPGQGHIHLDREGCSVKLTGKSEEGAIAIFDKK